LNGFKNLSRWFYTLCFFILGLLCHQATIKQNSFIIE
jgi:hypothetical protein